MGIAQVSMDRVVVSLITLHAADFGTYMLACKSPLKGILIIPREVPGEVRFLSLASEYLWEEYEVVL